MIIFMCQIAFSRAEGPWTSALPAPGSGGSWLDVKLDIISTSLLFHRFLLFIYIDMNVYVISAILYKVPNIIIL